MLQDVSQLSINNFVTSAAAVFFCQNCIFQLRVAAHHHHGVCYWFPSLAGKYEGPSLQITACLLVETVVHWMLSVSLVEFKNFHHSLDVIYRERSIMQSFHCIVHSSSFTAAQYCRAMSLLKEFCSQRQIDVVLCRSALLCLSLKNANFDTELTTIAIGDFLLAACS